MELEYINEFVTLVNVGNYQRAANRLFITQPTLSKHIKSLETELGFELFSREHHRLPLTDAGKRFLPYASNIAATYRKFVTDFQHLGDKTNKFTILVSHRKVIELLPNLIVQFRRAFPDYMLNAIQVNQKDVMERLKTADISIALTLSEKEPLMVEGYNSKVLHEYAQIAAFLPENHRMASQPYVTLEELQNESFITLPAEAYSAYLAQKAFREAGIEVTVAYTVNRKETALSFVRSGLAVLLAFQDGNHEELDGLVALPIYPNICAYSQILYRDSVLSAPEKWVINKLKLI